MTLEPATLRLHQKSHLLPEGFTSPAGFFRIGSGAHSRGLFRGIISYLVVFLSAFLIIFSRRPDAITNAQFFAEDGQRWYADAYRFGLRSVLIPDEAGGYLHTAPRLAALLSLSVPFSRAPLVMNFCAILVQVLPIIVLVSARFSSIALWKRLLASFLYLGLPNSFGTNANATNMQWHLALLACLVLLGTSTNDRKWKVFEVTVLVLMSVESPMGILFLPFAWAVWWMRRNRWAATLCAVTAPGAVLQTIVVLTSHSRQAAVNGASVARLLSIVGRQVFLAPLVGTKSVLHFALRYSAHTCLLLEGVATAAGVLLLLYTIRHAPVELKLFIGFSFVVFAMSLARPLAGTPAQPQWEWMRFPGTANRYYFLPIVAFLAALLWTVDSAKALAIRGLGIVLLLFLPFGIRRDWHYPPFTDMHFGQYASQFQAAPSGTRIVIPINPPPWSMELIKR